MKKGPTVRSGFRWEDSAAIVTPSTLNFRIPSGLPVGSQITVNSELTVKSPVTLEIRSAHLKIEIVKTSDGAVLFKLFFSLFLLVLD